MAKEKDELAVPAKAEITYMPQHKDDPSEVMWWRHVFRANTPRVINDKRIIESALNNPWFLVNGNRKEKPVLGEPTTPEAYRLHAVTWIEGCKSHHELEQKWEREEPMRQEIGVGSDDLDYILPRFNKRFSILKQQAA